MALSTRLFLTLSIAPFALAQSQFSTDVLALNPLGFWQLNGNATDATTTHNNGTLRNGVSFTSVLSPPVEAQAAVFDRSENQFVVMPTAGSSIFNLGSLHAFTAMAWVRTLGFRHMAIVSKVDPVVNNGWTFFISSGDGTFGLILGSAGFQTAIGVGSAVSVNDGRWHLVAATYDGSGKAAGIHLYVDGMGVAGTAGLDTLSGSILNSAPVTIGAAPDGSDGFDGNMNDVAVFGTALTPAQILQLTDDAATARAYLGQFAFGGGWYSAVYFTNTTLNDVSFPVTFTADSGTPLTVPLIGGSTKTITLAAGASTVIEALNVGQDVQQGYVTVTLPVGVTGYGVFRQSIPEKPDQEAVALLFPANAGNVPMVYDDTKYITGIAIANPTGNPTTVNITVTDNTGTVIATTSGVLPPFTKIEGLLRSLPAPFGSLSQIAGTQGTVRFATTSGSMVVLGLRANGTALTSIPTQTQSQISKFLGTP